MNKLPVLQSGFLSLTEESLVQTEPLPDGAFIRSLELGQPVTREGNPFFYNKDVEEIFKLYNADHRTLKSFDFRENLLKVAKEAFGSISFYAWVDYQLQSPYLTAMHRKFLNDTFQFIDSGKRDVNIESWMGLINPKEATALDKTSVVDTVRYFGRPGHDGMLPHTLSGIMARWTCQSNGFNDIMFFMAIVFSKQCLFNL